MTTIRPAWLIIPLLLATMGCERERAARAESDSHDHDLAGTAEVSDLDRPVDALFAAICEHGVPTHTCDECRYEVGVVCAPASLFDGGLLRRTTVRRESVRRSLALTGEVQLDERRVSHVRAPVDGIVRDVHVVLGDRVTAGAPLVTLASATVGEAQSEARQAWSALELARRTWERAERLHERGIGARKDYLEAQQALAAAGIRDETSRARLRQLGLGVSDTAAAGADGLGRLVLRAPQAGTVLTLHAVPGEVAADGESVATVGDHGAVWVWADVYERDLARVMAARAAGTLDANVTVTAYPDAVFAGVVDFIAPVMVEATRTARLRVAVDNPEGRLLAGMFATVALQLPTGGDTLVLPRTAVLQDEGRAFVFVHHHGDYFVRRSVETGETWQDRVEIRAGLAGDETLVADGAFLLKSDVLRAKMGAGCAD